MVVMVETIGNGITKTIVTTGDGKKPFFNDGAKVQFHFKTIKDGQGKEDENTIDDSKAYGKAFELLVGKKFKLECWEECIKTMQVGEVARFVCPAHLVIMYPTAAKNLREVFFKIKGTNNSHGHQCGMSAVENGLGFKDLDKLQTNPCSLTFEFQLLNVFELGEYEREIWHMTPDEMQEAIGKYHAQGNELYKKGEIEAAREKYASAIACLKNIQMKERPGTPDWISLDERQIPLLLNHAQCQILLHRELECITNCTEVLEKITGENNPKALYKRGKAHVALLDEREARKDFEKLLEVDPSCKKLVDRELRKLAVLSKSRDKELSSHLKGMF